MSSRTVLSEGCFTFITVVIEVEAAVPLALAFRWYVSQSERPRPAYP